MHVDVIMVHVKQNDLIVGSLPEYVHFYTKVYMVLILHANQEIWYLHVIKTLSVLL